jgi:hypothetical protein
MRGNISRISAAPLLFLLLASWCEAEAAHAKKLRLAFSAFAYANPPFWIAHELKLFEKYGGFDNELIYVGRRAGRSSVSSCLL